ncbi:MAG: hypothetical protein MJ082_06215 [Clostridia bacterium]|nr:hypothetical protein [Clostridia bacterium]
MKKEYKTGIFGIICLLLFTIWTVLVLIVDVKPVGIGGTDIGFSSVNTAFHDLTGVHWKLYVLTDILGAVPFAICLGFAFHGLYQWQVYQRF